MSDFTFVAIATYGREGATDSATHQRVPTIKCTPIAAEILLTLYREQARQLPHRPGQSYRYVALTPMPSLKQGSLIVRLTYEEFSRVETITRRTMFSWTYCWRDSRWWEFPTVSHPDYREAKTANSHLAPRFPPTSAAFVTISSLLAERVNVPAAAPSLHIEQNDGWWWISGDTYPVHDQLSAAGARWSKKRRQWYYIGAELPAVIRSLLQSDAPEVSSTPMSAPTELPAAVASVVGSDISAISASTVDFTPPPASAVVEPQPSQAVPATPPVENQLRVFPPPSADSTDPMVQAVRALPTEPLSMLTTTLPGQRNGAATYIPHDYCGELTGAISGAVYCYGYAVHEGICVYLNMGGPRMSVEAIRARLGKGESVNLLPSDSPALELSAGEGNTGIYTAYLQSIPEAKFTSAILVHERITQPDYSHDGWTYILHMSEAQTMAKLRQHVIALVSIPVFETWTPFLWRAGQQAGLISSPQSRGGLPIVTVRLEPKAWTSLLTAGLAHGRIQLA